MGEGTALTITIPWVPSKQCSPNNHTVSERTRIRHRRHGASEATYPVREVRMKHSGDGPVFDGEVIVDVLFRWPSGRKTQDRDNLITSMKFVFDQLQHEGVIANDSMLSVGTVTQEEKCRRPETILTIRAAARQEVAA